MRLLTVLVALSLTACGVIYHPVEKQGQNITASRLAEIEKGMSKNEVKYHLGQPTIQDTFSPNRWEYLYTEKNRGLISKKKRISLIFENDKLVELDKNS